MKKIIISAFICFSTAIMFGQHLELFGAMNWNNFHDYNNERYQISEYKPGNGYSFAISIDDIAFKEAALRFTFRLDNYSGEIYTRSGGLAGFNITKASVEKYSLGFEVFPLNFKILKALRINIGGSFNFLISEKLSGYKQSWFPSSPSDPVLLDGNTVELSNNFTFGIISRIAYNIKIAEKWYISPQYQFFFGLSNEFIKIQAKTKSMRHYLGLGIIKDLNKN